MSGRSAPAIHLARQLLTCPTRTSCPQPSSAFELVKKVLELPSCVSTFTTLWAVPGICPATTTLAHSKTARETPARYVHVYHQPGVFVHLRWPDSLWVSMEPLPSTKGKEQRLPRTQLLQARSAHLLVLLVESSAPVLFLRVRRLLCCSVSCVSSSAPRFPIVAANWRDHRHPSTNWNGMSLPPLLGSHLIADLFWPADTQSVSGNTGSASALGAGLEFIGLGSFTFLLGWILVTMV